jgi:hypothetical protein
MDDSVRRVKINQNNTHASIIDRVIELEDVDRLTNRLRADWESHGAIIANRDAELDKLRALADWLIAMDDPDSAEGMKTRQTVTLNRIIARASEARGSSVTPDR